MAEKCQAKAIAASGERTHAETIDEWESAADAETDDYRDLEYTKAGGGIITAEFEIIFLEEMSIEKEVAGDAGEIHLLHCIFHCGLPQHCSLWLAFA